MSCTILAASAAATSRDADAVAGARHAHSIEDETWDRGTVGLSHAGMRRYLSKAAPIPVMSPCAATRGRHAHERA